MKTKSRRSLILIFVLVLGVIIYWLSKPKEIIPEYVFSYAENQDADYPTTLAGQYFAQLVEERTNGRIKILVQHSGERGTEADVIKQLKYGGLDFARFSLTELTDEVTILNVLQMPYIYESSEHMWHVLDGEIGEDFLNLISEAELVGLSWYDAGARSFYTAQKPIRTLSDIQGKRIRVQGSNLMADMVECLGGEPVKQAYEEVYSLLERAEVQGAENNWSSYESMGHYEVAKYYTLDEHIRIPELQVCSQHTWEKLSEEDRAIIMECAKESSVYQREIWKKHEDEARENVLKNGAQIIELPAYEKEKFREAVRPLYKKYCSKYMDMIDEIIAMRND